MKLGKYLNIGPATMVAAAFIGPGTVVTASLAGASFGYALLWALLFAIVASMILQEMTARLGVVTQQGLGENIRETFHQPLPRALAVLLVVSAIVIGNAAYQSGNIAGASMGLEALTSAVGRDSLTFNPWPLVIAAIAFFLLWRGEYRLIEGSLVALVLLMSLAFLATLVITKPDLPALLKGLLLPSIPSGATLTTVALIGTTVVPYNLFLHSSSAGKKWQHPDLLPQARRDIYFSIPLGGLISIAIVSTAASAFFGRQIVLSGAGDIAASLQPLFGGGAQYFMGIGLFAAGISSALTAPLAAAYALSGILGLKSDMKSLGFRLVWFTILAIGTLVATLDMRPVQLIWFAQIANGLLLPIVTIFLLWEMNSSRLGGYRNSRLQNLLGVAVLLVTLLLGGRSLMSAFGWL
ncbi:NRAMP (natural resistance-associated macrophage protein) metal ion transporters [Microbulbifer donghaiensis]|uniref:NRAMP (Natural resistance-associated macrophage protein) metal ion transporters n=1 Tax=Microbulbifer donghaiensis TaxID=494016 RepID=A0A1M5HT33_9GAMM|nr:Nramp family divalent metal transporter [Microbulbifer donghaiensis]SHG19151.1 NRAMP (natural resistance-associated macrophage protein) metal ion transporters [Microbulbifer donghaiensis]